jgi:hypothetical protein
VQISTRDRLLLDTITRRVRIVSIAQAARTFWSHTAHPDANALRRIAALQTAGLVHHFTVMAHPELPLASPLLRWSPDAPEPDFGALSHRLKVRWTEPPRPTRVVMATPSAGTWLGGRGGRHPRPSEATHDLHLAAVYLTILRHAPDRAHFWLSEAQLQAGGAGRNEKLPDAMISSPTEQTVIEFGGAYPKYKLREFHAYCSDRGLAYEVW